MKLQILTFIAIGSLSLSSSASWYQNWCSNAAQTIAMTDGHNDTRTVISRENFETGETIPVEYDYDQIDKQVLKETLIKEESVDHGCWSSYTQISVEEVNLTRADGQSFPKNTVDLSENPAVVHTFLICRQEVEGEGPDDCEEERTLRKSGKTKVKAKTKN